MRCYKCGNELPDIAAFCDVCGCSVKDTAASVPDKITPSSDKVTDNAVPFKAHPSGMNIPDIDYNIIGDDVRKYVPSSARDNPTQNKSWSGQEAVNDATRVYGSSFVKNVNKESIMNPSETTGASMYGAPDAGYTQAAEINASPGAAVQASMPAAIAVGKKDGMFNQPFENVSQPGCCAPYIASENNIAEASPADVAADGKTEDKKEGSFPIFIFRIIAIVLIIAVGILFTIQTFSEFSSINKSAKAVGFSEFTIYYVLIWIIVPLDMAMVLWLGNKRKSTQLVISAQFMIAFLVGYLLDITLQRKTAVSSMFLDMIGVYIDYIWIYVSCSICAFICSFIDWIYVSE